MALILRGLAALVLLLPLAAALAPRSSQGCVFDSSVLGGCVFDYPLNKGNTCEANWANIKAGLTVPKCLVFKYLSTAEGWRMDSCLALSRGTSCKEMGAYANSWSVCDGNGSKDEETVKFPSC